MSKVKAILAEYEIGFVTHGKDVNEHLKKFETALKAQFIELTDRVIGENELGVNHYRLIGVPSWQRDELRAEQRKTRDQLVKEYFDE